MPLTSAERQRAYRERKAAGRNVTSVTPVTDVTRNVTSVAKGETLITAKPVASKLVKRQDSVEDGRGGDEAEALPLPVRTRDPKTGKFPKSDRKPLCPPATITQYERVKALMLEGQTLWRAINEVGCTRQAIIEASYVLSDWHGWNEVEMANKALLLSKISGEAIEAGVAQDRVTRTVESGPGGVVKDISKIERSVDVAALRLAGEHIAPEIHGKLAGAKQQQAQQQAVSITIVMGGKLQDVDDPPEIDVTATDVDL